jgi:hypothetical protein
MDFPLADLYAAMGDTCIYTPVGGGAALPIKAVLDARPGDVLGGDQVSTRYEVRLPASALPGAVVRGDRFNFAGVVYQATAAAQPIYEGAELSVPVKAV